MKLTLRFLLPSLLGAALAAPAMASTNLIFGFHTFGSTSAAENADVGPGVNIGSDFSLATVTKAVASTSTGGSSDGFYGGAVNTGPLAAPNGDPLGNGFLNLSQSVATVFTVQNVSAVAYIITGLSFDAYQVNSTSGARSLSVSYNVTNGGSGSVYSTTGILAYQSTNYFDYTDFDVPTSMIVPAGETLTISFLRGAGQIGLDNIAAVGEEYFQVIPEPSSLLALGCLISSGLAFRSRRRKAVA